MHRHPLSNVSGIYQITNTANGHSYVGSSKDVWNRWRRHKHDLRHRSHHSVYFQRAVDKYGLACFRLDLIETVPPVDEQLLMREQEHIDLIKPEYNMSKDARRNTPSREAQKRTADRNSKDYVVTCPDGSVKDVRNLSQFSRDNGLDHRYMQAVVRGRQYSHKGYRARLKDNPYPEYRLKTAQTHKVTKDGIVYELRNVHAFEREHGLSHGYLHLLLRGKVDIAKGFTRYEP